MKSFYIISFLHFISYVESFIDPFTLLAVGGGAWGLYNIENIKYHTYCRYAECCNDRYLLTDLQNLQYKLNNDLFGQHIAEKLIMPALRSHLQTTNSRKPLVLSFHGTPGTGKNFVADMIATSLYKLGLKSKYIHKFMGRADFPLENQVHRYKYDIILRVRSALAKCPRSLFIFDEVDKMPAGLFESLTSLVDYNHYIGGVDNTQAIYIFLSNTGGVQISNQLATLLKQGKLREHTKLSDFESILETASYNLLGGLHKSSMIETHVIDHFVPFLPLEKRHVIQCAAAESRRLYKNLNKDEIESLVNAFITYDPMVGLFSKSGCKKLHKKISAFD